MASLLQDLGERVKQVRAVREWTQTELAFEANLCTMTVSRLEAGASKQVYVHTLVAVARALGVSTDYLCGLVDEDTAVIAYLPSAQYLPPPRPRPPTPTPTPRPRAAAAWDGKAPW